MDAQWKTFGKKTHQLFIDGKAVTGKHRTRIECLDEYSRARRKRLKKKRT